MALFKSKQTNKTSEDFFDIWKLVEKYPKILYYIAFGFRGDGKTYGMLKGVVKKFYETGEQMAYVRRWEEDIKGAAGLEVFKPIIDSDKNVIEEITKGEYNDVVYKSRKWYLCHRNEDGEIDNTSDVLGHAFSISNQEKYKSRGYPKVSTIVLEEFMTSKLYLVNEFVDFMNLVSTIKRRRKDVKIIMLSNSINFSNPYFTEMGIKRSRDMNPGDFRFYKYGENNDATVLLHFVPKTQRKGESKVDEYFAFDNPKLNLMTGDGNWQLEEFPHLTEKYRPKQVKLKYFIEYDEELVECDIVKGEKDFFTYIYRRTKELDMNKKDIIFTKRHEPNPRFRHDIMNPYDKIGSVIKSFFDREKVYYQDNEVGTIVRNFIGDKMKR